MALSRNWGSLGFDDPAEPTFICLCARTVEIQLDPYALVNSCSTTGRSPLARTSSMRPTRSLFVTATVALLSQPKGGLGRHGGRTLRLSHKVGPRGDEGVV